MLIMIIMMMTMKIMMMRPLVLGSDAVTAVSSPSILQFQAILKEFSVDVSQSGQNQPGRLSCRRPEVSHKGLTNCPWPWTNLSTGPR